MSNKTNFKRETVKIIKEIGSIKESKTQSVRVILAEEDGKKLVSIQKWWRKNDTDDWIEGKGFQLNKEDSEVIRDLLSEALEVI